MLKANLCRKARVVVASLINILMIVGPIAPRAVVNASPRTSLRKPVRVALLVPAAPATLALPGPVPAPAPFVVNITATKVDNYSNFPNPALPGDTIDYTITITNSGSTDATAVVFNDDIDPNTTLVPGSITATPNAVNDSYDVIASDTLNIAAPGVLGNDTGSPAPTVTQVQGSGANVGVVTPATGGGTVTLQANGSFVFNAPAVPGPVTFTYQAGNAHGSNTATVTINVQAPPTANNDGPAAGSVPGDPYHTALNQSIIGPTAYSVLTNDTGSAPLTVVSYGVIGNEAVPTNATPTTQGGSITLNTAGNLLNYTPPSATFVGVDTFQYTMTSSIGGSSTAMVTIKVGIPPTANADAFNVHGNIGISITTANDPMNNDTGDQIVIQSYCAGILAGNNCTTANGGTFNMAANGAFTYNPPVGYTGNDTVNYVISNGLGTSNANITFTISNMIWFIDNSGGVGDGRWGSPFNTVNAFTAVNDDVGTHPSPGDRIYIFTGTGPYNTTAGLVLLNNQIVIGAGSDLATIVGALPLGSPTLPGPGTKPNLRSTVAAIYAIDLASGNTIRGLDAGVAGNTTTRGIGNGGGNVTVTDNVTVNANGGLAVLISGGGTMNVTFGSITSANSANSGISVASMAGTFTVTGTTSITSSSAGGDGVTLSNNSATFTFAAVNVNNTATNSRGFSASGNTGTITTTSGTINSGSGEAVNIDGGAGTTPLAISLTSVSSTGGNSNGISIQKTSGSFTVNGDGTNTTQGGNGTGGTISNKSGVDGNTTQGIGVFLNNATNITLRRMTINGTNQNFGIRGTSVSNLVVEYSTISGTEGTSAAADEGSIIFDGLTGTSTFTNLVVAGSIEDNFRVRNSSGTANNIAITGSSFTNSPNDNIALEPSGTAVMTAHVTNNTFSGAGGDHLQTATTNSATLNIIFTGNLFSMGSFVGSLLGGVTISGGNLGSTETCNFDISNNGTAGSPLVGTVQGGAININQGNGGGTWQGRVSTNLIGNAAVTNSGCAQCGGIRVENHSVNGTLTALVSGNTIRQWNSGPAINSQTGDAGNATNTGPLNLTLTSNTASNPGASAQHGFVANMGAAANSADVSCVDASSNSLDGNAGAGGSGLRLRHRNGNTVRLPGYAGTQFDTAAVIAYANTRNPGSTPAPTATTSGLGGGFTNTIPASSPCVQPTVPASITNDTSMSEGSQNSRQQPPKKQISQQSRPTDGVVRQLVTQPIASKQEVKETKQSISTGRLLIPAKRSKQDPGYSAAYSTRDKFISNEVAQQKKKGARITIQPKSGPLVNAGPITIGTLRAGDSVTITFQVTINNPYAGGPNVSNQGTVSGSNFSDVLTDDPAVGGAADPTLTPVTASPNINVNDAKVGEPATGSTPMVFTVALTSPAGGAGVQVDYATADQPAGVGHAVAGQDYTATSGTLNFGSGEQIKTVSVDVLSDADNTEPDETFLLNLSNAVNGNIVDAQAVGTITPTNAAGTFLISEIRTSGPAGAGDDFVELYNSTDSPLTVAASDASAGYGVYKMGADCNASPILIGTIPNGTVIPARGHYLLVGSSYSLSDYGGSNAAAGDLTLTSDIENDRNVAVFTTAEVLAISSATRLDAIGFGTNTGGTCDLLREGSTAAPVAGSLTEHSFSRDVCGKGGSAAAGLCPASTPVDTNTSSTDFIFADTQGTFISGVTQRLGAPGPENLSSPIQRNNTFGAFLLDQTKARAVAPNRFRDLAAIGPNATFGTMSIRRRLQNNTGAPVTRLRFRLIDISSFLSPGGGVADLRALTSVAVSVSGVDDPATCLAGTGSPATPCTIMVQGTTLEAPPSQPNGGAHNSTVSAGTITLATPLAPGASVMVQLLLGVQTTGIFKFYVNAEALP